MRFTKLLNSLILVSILCILSCSNDDTLSLDDLFLEDALTTVKKEQLEGKWSVSHVKFENTITEIPASFSVCGNDFFEFMSVGRYRDYVFNDNYECTPDIEMLTWTLADGLITLTDEIEVEQMVITELSSDRLVLRALLDIDSDGASEIYYAICDRYEPPMEIDSYSGTFKWKSTVESLNKIILDWDSYEGYNQFEKYEIYRLNEDCNSNTAELISTITDMDESSFTDETPPIRNTICYLFKIYTNEGLLGESKVVRVSTGYFDVPPIQLSEPSISSTQINLNWEKYSGWYFSHYEIEIRNYSKNSGSGEEETIVKIYDIETTSFSAKTPYVADPVYVINVYNIFGDKNDYVIEGQNKRSTTFLRKEIVPIHSMAHTVFSLDEPILYYLNSAKLHRYNYSSNTVESSTEINSSSIIFIKIFESSYGTEVMVNIGGTIKVYDTNLNYKYSLNQHLEHLILTEDGYWLATDRDKLYSFSRTDHNLNKISSNSLYNRTFSSSRINLMDIGQNKILIGNKNESQGLIIEINSIGELARGSTETNSITTSEWRNNALFSKEKRYILNVEDNNLYSSETYNLLTKLDQKFFTSGISNDGSLILGSYNNPAVFGVDFYERKLRTLNYPSLTEQVYDTKGYPHYVFKNHLGQLISISKYFIGALGSSPNNDVFIEIIEESK